MAGGTKLQPKDAAALEQMRADLERQLATLDRILGPRKRDGGKPPTQATAPLAFDARVAVSSKRRALKSINGRSGTVVGRAPADDGWVYAVMVDGVEECWSVPHRELTRLSESAPSSAKAPRESIRVRVDRQGRGHIVKQASRHGAPPSQA